MKGIIVVLAVLSGAAHAGQQLHLRTGAVDPIQKVELNKFVPATLSVREAMSAENFIVQFQERITAADRALLEARGMRIINYIPDDAYLVQASSDAVRGLDQEKGVRAVVPMMAAWKISPEFAPRSVFSLNQRETVIVRLRSTNESKRFTQNLARVKSAQLVRTQGRVARVEVASADLDRLAALEEVQWLQPDPQFKILPMNMGERPLTDGEATDEPKMKGDYTDLSGFEDGTKVMKFPAAYERGFTGKGQIVAMSDTGLDSGDASTLFQDFAIVSKGYTFGLYADNWNDPMGHGTHVAGSVMGAGKASNFTIHGGAYEAGFIPEGMWSPILNNLTVPDDLATLFQPVYDDGARIHTNSWGGARQFGAYDDYAAMADDFIWNHPDMLVLFAAGNSGVDADQDGRIDENSMASPGTAKNVLTVGASENYVLVGGIQKKLGDLLDGEPWGTEPLASDTLSNNENGIAAFSSRGPTLDGRLKPEIVAPGTNVLSNCSHVPDSSPLWGNYNADYCWSGGTSMATPLTAGAAAVARQYLISELSLANPSAAVLKAWLMHTADDLYPGQYGDVGKARGQELLSPGPNNDQGYGRVNVDRATTPKSGDYIYSVIDDKAGLNQGGEFNTDLNSQAKSGSFKATLIYTDAPGAANATKTLVNDLDLVVTLADGTVVKSESRVDNKEQVSIANLGSAVVSVRVLAYSVPQGKDGKQPFALVVSK